jgi:hypothetical protein
MSMHVTGQCTAPTAVASSASGPYRTLGAFARMPPLARSFAYGLAAVSGERRPALPLGAEGRAAYLAWMSSMR